MLHLVILGNGLNRDLCPYDDKSYEIWGLGVNLFRDPIKRMDKIFEIHRKDEYLHDTYKKIYETILPVYLQRPDKKVKNQKLFPIDKIIKKYGDYHCSSFSLILCYAVDQGYKNITFHGIDYDITGTDREKTIEKANLEYWIGYFRAKGIIINTGYTELCKSIYCYGRDDIIKPLFFFDKIEKQYKKAITRARDEKEKDEITSNLKFLNNIRSYF